MKRRRRRRRAEAMMTGTRVQLSTLIFCLIALVLVPPLLVRIVYGYLIVPLRFVGRPMQTEMQAEQLEVPAMPPAVADHAARAARQLVPRGFTAAVHVREHERLPGKESYTSLWLNPAAGTAATVRWVAIRIRARTAVAALVAFRTEFADGRSVGTSNVVQPPSVGDPLHDAVRWPGMQDLAVLYRLHQARVAALGRGTDTVLPPPEKALEYLRARSARGQQLQVDAGYFRADPAAGTLVGTAYGAFARAWKLQGPLLHFTQRRDARNLRRALAAAGMGDPAAYAAPPPDGAAAPRAKSRGGRANPARKAF